MSGDRPFAPATQRWSAARYAQNARFVAVLGASALELLAPQRDERILDLGCGDGALSAQIVASGATVVGVDSSPELVAAARALGVDARVMSGEALDFSSEFDAVFSNAALHWMTESEAVLRGVRRALTSGGRFVGEFGGHGNVAAIRTALAAALGRRGLAVASPWYFPTAETYARRLQSHGFRVHCCTLFARPTLLPTGLRGWLDTFANPFVGAVDAHTRNEILDEVSDLLAPVLRDDKGRWTADYIRLRFASSRD